MSKEDERNETGAKASESTSAERKPYVVPLLRHLGSVRELTLGSGGDVDDSGGLPGQKHN